MTPIKVCVANLQSGVAVTKGYWEYPFKWWKYVWNHSDWPLKEAGISMKYDHVNLALLTEVSENCRRTGFTSQIQVVARYAHLPYRHYFSGWKKKKDVDEGNGLLSSFPIKETKTYNLPAGTFQRILTETTVSISGKELTVFITHLGIKKSDRERQLVEIVKILKNCTKPFIVGGDFNSSEHHIAEHFAALRLSCHSLPTFPSWKPKRNFDQLWVTDDLVVKKVSILLGRRFSDHLPLCVDLEF